MTTPETIDESQAIIQVNLFGGDRKRLDTKQPVLIRVRDGAQKEHYSEYYTTWPQAFIVPFFDNLYDSYAVLATSAGMRDAGFYPVKVSHDVRQQVDLMLVAKKADFSFVAWDALQTRSKQIFDFLCCAGDAQGPYMQLMANKKPALASLLNLAEAMRVIALPNGSPLDYFKEILWDQSLAQDRFFAYVDAELINQVRLATAQGEFSPEPNPGLFHPDATSSYKQIQFGEANVQLTFHEKNKKQIGQTQCVVVEPDIDYYKDLGAHGLLEVIPNTLGHGLTDPQLVYVLRWMAGRHAGVPEFDPPYTLTQPT